jgi:uncharacterized cupredoxin-like copper-binding protein
LSTHAGRSLAALAVAVPVVVGACASTDDKSAVAVTAGNTTCQVAKTQLPAGTTIFKVTNEGDDVTEVYVYAKGDRVKGEVENVGPGTSRTLSADLTAGNYEVACKPGMTGDGIRTTITVTGRGGQATATPDRTADVTAIDYAYQGLEGLTFTTGETVEFALTNAAPAEEHEMEVLGPDGQTIGEVGPTKPGATGTVVLTLGERGTYRVRCGIDDHAKKGMSGTFSVG